MKFSHGQWKPDLHRAEPDVLSDFTLWHFEG